MRCLSLGGGMQRRGVGGQPSKGRGKRTKPKGCKAPTAPASIADRDELLDQRTRERDEALEQQAATSEVLSIIRRSPTNAEPVFDAIVESAARLCGAIFSISYLYDGKYLRIAATKGFTPAATRLFQENQRRPQRSHLGGRAILDSAVVHVPDVLADPEYSREYALAGGWRAVLAVPLLRDGAPLGALSVAKAEPTPFSDRQIQLLKTFADQAVIAIENTRLLKELRQRTDDLSESLEQQTATSKVLQVISSSPGQLYPVFNAVLENAVRICGAKFCILYLVEGDGCQTVAMHDVPKRFAEKRTRTPFFKPPAAGKSPMGRVMATRQVAQIDDITQGLLEGDQALADLAELGGARTVLAVPMLKDADLVGGIVIYRQEVRRFTERQIELVQNFAAQAVIAIENTRLLNELRESLQQQTATADVLKIISSSPGELGPVFQAMLEQATHICEAKFGLVVRYEGGLFHPAATLDLPPALADFMVKQGAFAPKPGQLFGRLCESKTVINVVDRATDPEPSPSFRYGGARSSIAVPMLKDDELLGAFFIYRTEVRPFTDKQIELVKNFAAQAVIAIENTRLLNELRESLQQQTATADVLKIIS